LLSKAESHIQLNGTRYITACKCQNTEHFD
jgi:hypothetical protein